MDSTTLDDLAEMFGFHYEPAHPNDCNCYEYGTDTTKDGYWHEGRFVSKQALLKWAEDLCKEVIGSDDRAEFGSVMKNIVNEKVDKAARNKLRAEQRAKLLEITKRSE